MVTRQWLGQLSPYREAKVVTDHRGWPYFAQRFGLDIVEHLEHPPGISPTMKHPKAITLMKAQGIKVILATAFYDPNVPNLSPRLRVQQLPASPIRLVRVPTLTTTSVR